MNEHEHSKNREWALDGLRGVAALVVVAEHYLKHFYPVSAVDYAVVAPGASWWEYLSIPPFNLFTNGAAAVSLFFVLSGYVLALSAFRAGREYPVVGRLAGRYVRLALPVTASLLLLYLYNITAGYDGQALMSFTGSMERPADLSGLTLQSALSTGLIGSMFFMSHSLNAPLWTITYEAIGSALIMIFCWSSAKMALPPAARLLAYIFASLLLFDTFLIGFVFGAALADASRSMVISRQIASRWGLLGASAIGILLLSFGLRGLHSSPYAVVLPDTVSTLSKYTVNAVGAAFILLAVVISQPSLNACSHRVKATASWLGMLSFPIYLLHYPLISVVGSKVFFSAYTAIGLLDPSSPLMSIRYWTSSGLAVFCSFLATLIAASYFARFVDIPSISAARRLHSIERIAK